MLMTGVKNDVGYHLLARLKQCRSVATYDYRECFKLLLTKWSKLNIFISVKNPGIQVNFINVTCDIYPGKIWEILLK